MDLTILFLVIALAIVFDFINGFHDAANSIATVVTTKVLTPIQAIIWAAFFNFVAFFIAKFIIGEFGVADTISKIIKEDIVTSFGANPSVVIMAALLAAITWNLLTWKLGIPSSSSHTLIGGLAGGALASTGFNFSSVNIEIILTIVAFIFVAPVIGLLAGNIISIITLNICRNVKPHKADTWFKRLQLVSSALLSIGHGLNDSQKVMGVITFALLANQTAIIDTDMNSWYFNDIFNWKEWFITENAADIHDWVPIVCFSAIAIGTLGGGMKILKTMGNKITKITPIEGFTAQTASAVTLFFTEHIKMPVSTTHVITGSIIGVGMVKRVSAVRWGVTVSLLWAWVLTIPISALIATAFYYFLKLFF
ncbi:inorganic phosphate transporter [Faecalibacter sp. LW9]|uniref:inorganic phosphate transporter n=1 Tax=Faecalibacter sp. LW9 TaxID=3103144 RepID=UPI002AFE1FBF|nr:inorganic phosphate transporter [Faecalibacter sp. LW9]